MPTFSYPAKFKCGLIFLLLFAATSLARGQCISINDSIVTFKGYCSPDLTIDQINLSNLRFQKHENSNIDFGIVGNEYYYIVLKLNSSCFLKDRYLSIANTSIDTVNIYRVYPDRKSQLLYQGGALVAFKNRKHYVWHTVLVDINKSPAIYVIALKAPQKNINVRYEILDVDELQKKYQDYDRLVFFYAGIVCLIIAIIILALFLFKKIVFAAYLGYIVCLSGWILSHYGYVFPIVYPHLPVLNEIAKPVTSLGTSIFLLLMLSMVFRNQLKSCQWLRRSINYMLYVLPVLTGFMFFLPLPGLDSPLKATLIMAWHIGLIFSIVIIVSIPLRLFNSGFTARIFSLAMLVICIMSIVQLFSNSGYFYNFFLNEHGMTMGSILEFSIMAFGLFYNLLEEKKQKDKQVQVLELEKTETLKKLITVQDSERKRIAGDLHDNIGPLLAALKINFRRIIHTKEEDYKGGLVTKTESIIDDSIAEIRNVAHNLMPKSLSSKGLINTLAEYFESLQQLYNITIAFNHQIKSIFHSDLQINSYRIICELVLNAARHSNASLITVRIIGDEKYLYISIRDDGQGFQQNSPDQKESLGLQSAESRVLYLKGKFSLQTESGKGTFISIEIPLQFYEIQVNGF